VALPDGRIVALAKFFDRSLSVRDAVKAIVAAEIRPLTDDEIAARLAGLGYAVARRTVAKYRAAEGILPAVARARIAAAGRARPA
jgi:RNA polymerase sigma-54 factor